MNNRNIALIDIGSNSIRLVIFSLNDHGYYKEIQNLKIVARLSSHLDEKGDLTNEGISVLLDSLYKFQEVTRTFTLQKIKCVATAAIRQAKNQQEVLDEVNKNTDFTIRVLSEYEEAFFGYLAVTNSTNIENGITVDIGGGSTEITLFKNRSLLYYHSFPFGAISLNKRFIHNEIPTEEELNFLRTYLKEQFQTLPWLNQKESLPLLAIGGSARNLSLIHQRKINYPLIGLHQYEIDYNKLNEIRNDLNKLSHKERQSVDGLSKDRADIIIPAVEAITTLMEVANSSTFIMSNKGLREGLFYEELLKERNLIFFPNVAEESLSRLTFDYKMNLQQVTYLSKLATLVFHELKDTFEHELTMDDLYLLQLSCRVLYLGEFISHEASSQHTFYLLTNLSIDGLTHFDRLKMALIASFKSKNTLQSFLAPFKDWFQKNDIEKVELLGAILKFSYSLNRTNREVITTVKTVGITEEKVILKLIYKDDPFFEVTQAQKYKKHLERILKKRVELLICND